MAAPNNRALTIVEEPVPPLQQDKGELTGQIVPKSPVPWDEEAHKGLSGDRYRLKTPVCTCTEDVEQFIQELSDVVAVTHWPPRVTFLQFWLALTDKAKPYGSGLGVNSIFVALSTQFSLSAIDTQLRLQGLWHDPCTSLQEYAATVKRLV